ncbi:MAG: hypothetical protein V5A43_11455 [Haloarculaceae archaeon]
MTLTDFATLTDHALDRTCSREDPHSGPCGLSRITGILDRDEYGASHDPVCHLEDTVDAPDLHNDGGYLIAAVPIDATNATDGEILAYENLRSDHQDAFDRMLDGDHQGHPRTPAGFPASVRYNGTV